MSERVPGTTRRAFLILSAKAGLVATSAAMAAACADEDDTQPQADGGADAGADVTNDAPDDASMDAAVDTSGDSGVDGANDAATDTDASADVDAGMALSITKGPYTQIMGPNAVRLRFELPVEAAVAVALIAADGSRSEGTAELSTEFVEMQWPVTGLNSDFPDVPGDYTLQDVLFTDLTPGERYTYEIELGGGEVAEGAFRAPVAPGTAFRVAWVSDTMMPSSEETGAMCGQSGADVLIHGGDIQYMSNPLDTWNGYFRFFAEAFAAMPAHHTIGNHEYEEFNEFESQYMRLFGGQGQAGTDEYHAFTVGSVRFIILNSEEDFGADGPQMTWLEEELAAVQDSDELAYAIVAFHRPFWTLSRSGPNLGVREYVHGLMIEYGVPLVLTGHNHCYERFEVDGITYIVDGGGGAFLYNVNDNLEEITAERPEEPQLRQAFEQSYGMLTLEIAAGGGIEATRRNVDGETSDTFSIEA